jgi:HEAT repeat protein
MKTRVVLLVAMFMSAIATSVRAELVPPIDIKDLVSNADMIVIGTIATFEDLGSAPNGNRSGDSPARLVTGEIIVRQVLKGRTDSDRIKFLSPVRGRSIDAGWFAANTEAVLFLKRNGQETKFASPIYPMVRTSSSVRVEKTDPLEAVVEAISSVLVTPGISSPIKLQAIYQLRGLPMPSAVAGLRAALKESDRTVRIAAIGALLSDGDLDVLPLAEKVLMGPDGGTTGEIANIRGSLRTVRNPAAIPTLARLIRAEDVETRRAVAEVLGKTRSKEALQPLRRALDDADFEVRLNAVRALSQILDSNPLSISEQGFRNAESRLLDQWKARLMSMGVDAP